jgi:hypothetical protein
LSRYLCRKATIYLAIFGVFDPSEEPESSRDQYADTDNGEKEKDFSFSLLASF